MPDSEANAKYLAAWTLGGFSSVALVFAYMWLGSHAWIDAGKITDQMVYWLAAFGLSLALWNYKMSKERSDDA